MKARTVYVAEWVAEMLPGDPTRDFDPYHDVLYSTSEHLAFEDARAAALAHENGYGYATVHTVHVDAQGRRSDVDRDSVL